MKMEFHFHLLHQVLQLRCWKSTEQIIQPSSYHWTCKLLKLQFGTFEEFCDGTILQQSKFIVCDKYLMVQKIFEDILDYTMKDLSNNQNWFGGGLIILASDFRQILLVIPWLMPTDEINESLSRPIMSIMSKHSN